MKKIFFTGIAVLAIAAIAAFNVNLSTNTEESLLTLANVEALAEESTPSCDREKYTINAKEDWEKDETYY